MDAQKQSFLRLNLSFLRLWSGRCILIIKFTAPEDRVIRVTVKVTDKVTDKEQELLTLLAEDPGYTMPQLAERLSVSRKTVAARLKKLKEAGLIERIGSDRKGYWKLLK